MGILELSVLGFTGFAWLSVRSKDLDSLLPLVGLRV